MELQATTLDHLEGFWRALDQVARERRYLLFTEAPPIERTKCFLEEIVARKWTQFFAVENGEVIGWCDIVPYPYEGCTHVGHLGMGVVREHRGKGVGHRLIEAAIANAFTKGMRRIDGVEHDSLVMALRKTRHT